MTERRSNIYSNIETNNDDQLLDIISTSVQGQERISLDISDEPIIDINSPDDKDSDIEPLLDECHRQSSITDTTQCLNTPARYIIAIWAFWGFFCLYAMRVNLSVAVVAMVTPQSTLNQSVQSCPVVHENSTEPSSKYEFDWNPTIEGIVLGAFFYGYITMQIIGGNLAEKFGAKWIFGGGTFVAGLLTLLTPLAARTHVGLLIAARFLTGVVSGPGFPSAAALWGKWIPPAERSTIPPAAQSGTNIGTIFTTPLISIMIERKFLGGWPSAFYVFGAVSCLWFIGWCFFGFNSPEQHPRITKKEQIFLQEHIPKQSRIHRKTPWNAISRCPPIYALATLHICTNYIYYTLLTSLPTYFATILNFNLHQNGFIFALPYLAQFLITITSGNIVDRIRARKIFTITTIRKTQAMLGCIGSCSCLVTIGFMGCNHFGAVICCTFSIGFLGLLTSGPLISHLDIASNYAGTLVGITNSLATIPGFVGPYVVGALTNNNQTLEAWRVIFWLSAGIGMFGGIIYCLLFNGEEQSWNRTDEEHE